jgi:hypothetical protein
MKKIIICSLVFNASAYFSQSNAIEYSHKQHNLPADIHRPRLPQTIMKGELSPLLPSFKIWSGKHINAYLAPENIRNDHIVLLAMHPNKTMSSKQSIELDHIRNIIGDIYKYNLDYDGFHIVGERKKLLNKYGFSIGQELIPIKINSIKKRQNKDISKQTLANRIDFFKHQIQVRINNHRESHIKIQRL